MDMVLVTLHIGDQVVVNHAAAVLGDSNIKGLSHPKELSICQRVLEGRLPAAIPDLAALS